MDFGILSRLDDLFRHAQSTLNRDIHSLVWNRKSGKQPTDLANFGLLYCRACGRTWPWIRRHTVFKHTTCQPPDHLPPPPPWVSCTAPTHHEQPAQSTAVSHENAPPRPGAIAQTGRRVRLRRKSTPTPHSAQNVDAHHDHARQQQHQQPRELPSGSRDLPRMGIG